MLAVGTISQIVGVGFDPTPVYWSAAYTQNAGQGGQINGSFNNSTTPPPPVNIPEPATLALLGQLLLVKQPDCNDTPIQDLSRIHI